MNRGFMVALARAVAPRVKAMHPVSDARGGWWPIIRESYPGAWQQNVTVDQNMVLSQSTVFACMTLIASDIAKLRVKLVEKDSGIWTERENSAFSPVLRKPNHFQTRIQFWESWMLSKLSRGNTYVLKQRDNRGVVTKLYVLDPTRVKPLISPSGEVFYDLNIDNIPGVTEQIIVPAREIIHDRFNCLYHPLVGVSPIYACGLAATQGLRIQDNSARFFENHSSPGGILTAPGKIEESTAKRLKDYWEGNFSGANVGKVAVLGDDLKYQGMTVSPVDAQLVEQLRWTAETVCSVFRVPAHMVGVGPQPTHNNVQALLTGYYAQCLQALIEAAETVLDDGLGTGEKIGVEFDTSSLLRMDTATQVKSLTDAIGGSLMAVNEARVKLDLPPLAGGDSVFLQQQYFSLQALAERDANSPFSKPDAAPPGAQATGTETAKLLNDMLTRLQILEHREEALHEKMMGRRK